MVSPSAAFVFGPRRYIARKVSRTVPSMYASPVHRFVWDAQRYARAIKRVSERARERERASSPFSLSLRRTLVKVKGFAVPLQWKVAVCLRRDIRRRVLFALGGAGNGRKVSRVRRHTQASKVRC